MNAPTIMLSHLWRWYATCHATRRPMNMYVMIARMIAVAVLFLAPATMLIGPAFWDTVAPCPAFGYVCEVKP